MTKSKPWFNDLHNSYQGNQPNYFMPENFTWATEILKNNEVIQKEADELISYREKEFNPYFSKMLVDNAGGWKTITLKTWGIPVYKNLNRCPELKKLIEKFPEWTSASISLLEPGTVIKSHQGDTDAILRAHLGISIPGEIPECGMEVNGENRSWKKNELLIFLDAHNHKAWNNTKEKRIIMIFDFIKEKYLNMADEIKIRVRVFLILQFVAEKFPFIKRMPKWIHKILFMAVSFLLQFLLPIQKKYGVLIEHK